MAHRLAWSHLWFVPRTWHQLAVLVSLALLGGCGAPDERAFTLQAAVRDQVRAAFPGTRLLAAPVLRCIHRTPAGTTAVVYTAAVLDRDVRTQITSVTQFEQRGLGWGPIGSGGSVFGPARAPLDAYDDIRGGGADDPQQLAYAYGLVHDAQIVSVRVTFADGTQVDATIEQGAYLAVAQGVGGVIRVEALDGQGRVIPR